MLKILLIICIICILINTNVIGKIIDIILPFILSLILSYITYPIYKRITKYLNKYISIFIIILCFISTILLLSIYIIPLLYKELIILIESIINYINIIGNKYNLNITNIISNLYKLLDYKSVINGISLSISLITNFLLFFISYIYVLLDIDSIISKINKYKNTKLYNLILEINKNLKNYLSSLLKISIISFFEYGLSFYLIKYPNFLLIALVASFSNLIPYIGSILILIFALIINPYMIIKVSILYLILSLVDTYIINPYIFGKYNQIHPLLELISISIFSLLFDFLGIILSIPLTIIILTIIKFYQTDIRLYIKTKLFKNNLL